MPFLSNFCKEYINLFAPKEVEGEEAAFPYIFLHQKVLSRYYFCTKNRS